MQEMRTQDFARDGPSTLEGAVDSHQELRGKTGRKGKGRSYGGPRRPESPGVKLINRDKWQDQF